jgi:hypothetical protein
MSLKHSKGFTNLQTLKDYPKKDLRTKDARGNHLGFKGTYLVFMQTLDRKGMHNLVVLKNVQDKIVGKYFT